jgi:hypothetical protein
VAPWLIVTGGSPAWFAAAAGFVLRHGGTLVLVVEASTAAAVALTLGCGSLLRRRQAHRVARPGG